MDHVDHEEVVREPFEDSQSIDESADDNDDDEESTEIQRNDRDDTREHNRDEDLDRLDRLASLASQMDYNQDTREDGESTDEGSTSSFAENLAFANSFGINLKAKSSREELIRQKLLRLSESSCLSPQSSSSSSSSSSAANCCKPQVMIETSVTSDCIYHKGTYYQKGDIVAICDQDDGLSYFAQLVGFLQDQYCEKSASVSWLVPTRPTSRDLFDPSAYEIGLDDPQLRKLECMTFVRHCPHDYYTRKLYQLDQTEGSSAAGISLVQTRSKRDHNYIWTTMEACRVPRIATTTRK